MSHAVNVIANVLLLGSLPAVVLFIFFYSRKSPWKKHFVGRSIMYLGLSLFALLMLNAVTIWIGPHFLARPWIRLAVYSGLFLSVWRLFYTLRGLQKNPPDEGPDTLAVPLPEPQEVAPDDRI